MTPVATIQTAPRERRVPALVLDTLTVSGIACGAKAAGALKSVAIARVFGSGADLDNYLLAFMIPSVLADTFCGAMVPVAVPRLIEMERQGGRAAWLALYARLLARSLQFALLGAAAIAAAVAVFLKASSSLSQWRAVALLAAIMLPLIPSTAIANVWRAALNSQGRFAAAAGAVVVTPVVITIAVLTADASGGVWMLAAATVCGAAGELALLALAMRTCGLPVALRTRLGPAAPGAVVRASLSKAFRKEYGYLVLSGAVSGAALAAGQAMAAWLGAGSVSILNYGTRLSVVLIAIGPAALGVTVVPSLSRMAADRDWEKFKPTLRRLLAGSIAVSIAAAAVFILVSGPVVRIALQRGAFTAADTHAVAAVQACSLLQLPFVVGIAILMRVFSILQANRVLLPLSAAALAANLTLNYALMNRYGVPGIALAGSVAQAMLFAAMLWAALRLFRQRSREEMV